MEANKCEAEKCIEYAEKCINHNNFEKAKEVLKKANRLYPSQKATDLQTRIRQQQEVNRINASNKHDYYKILDIAKTATKKIIKEKYYELCKRVHPDKSGCPGTEEAFKLVDNAYRKLINEDRNNSSNITNSDKETDDEIHNRFYARDFSSKNPEPSRTFHTQNGYWRWEESPRETNFWKNLIYYLILAVVVLWLCWNLFVPKPTPLYSLEKNSEYSVRRQTNLGITYFVRVNFNKPRHALLLLEKSINDDYLTNIKNLCDLEKSERDLKMWKARDYSDRRLFKEAHYMAMPNCDTFLKFQ